MLDSKKIIQLGLGVAIGMIAWHFIQQQMNKSALNGDTAGAFGRSKRRQIRTGRRPMGGGTTDMQGTNCNCGTTSNPNWKKCLLGAYGTCAQCCGSLPQRSLLDS